MSDIISSLPVNYEDISASTAQKTLHADILAASIEESLTHWHQQLAGAPAILQLPYDHARSATQELRQATYSFALPAHPLQGLATSDDEQGEQLFPVLLTVLATLFYRYTAQDDLLIGIPITAHANAEAEINVLPVRVDLADNPTFITLLERVRKSIHAAYTHRNLAFSQIVAELPIADESGMSPAVQVLCTLPGQEMASATMQQAQDAIPALTRLDIGLELRIAAEELQGTIVYNANLFEQDTIVRMAEHYHTLLQGIAADAQQQVDLLPLLTPAERQQLLIDWNATTLEYPADQRITDLFEAQVARTPEATALVFGKAYDQSINYRELNAKANQLARFLQKMGAGPETRVGVYIRRSPEMFVALLGILKSGAAYIPLDPAYPAERIAFMLHDADISIVLTQQPLVEKLPGQIEHVIRLDADRETIGQESEENMVNPARADNLAYVIYTSGSTGEPKGVAIEQRNTVAFIHWALQIFTTEDLTGVIASTSINFDVSIFEIFVTLSSGGSIILVENALHVLDLPASVQPRVLSTVTSALNELVYSGKLPTSLRTIVQGGEPLSGQLVQQLYQRTAVQRIYNMYGPTEDTTYSTYALMERDESKPPIGRPIANTQAYILDAHLQPVPRGIVGELYLSGAGLTRGYLNRPEQEAERFLRSPFSDGARIYKTGDMVRYRRDGSITYLGRRDHQVKIRGFRVELEEIERAISQLASVREAVVAVRETPAGGKQLVAYIVAAPGQTLATSELRQALQQKLPEYMVPERIVTLTELPIMPNGKVNRHALPAPEETQPRAEEALAAPTTLTQHRLLTIWQELLGTQQIGITDNFFYLGGNSLLAARLLATIEHTLGKKLSLTTLMANPTIEQIASALEQPEDASARFPIVKLRGGSKRPFFYLHGDWTGGAFYCFTLAHAMQPEQPFYAVAPYNYDGEQGPLTLEEMAVAYIAALRAIQPEGPYLIGGFCNGGLMAYEIARQLRQQGQQVDLLLLVEPADAGYGQTIYGAIHAIRRLLHQSRLQELDMFLRVRHLCKMLQPSPQKRKEDLEYLQTIDSQLLTVFPPTRALRKDHVGVFTWATAAYSFASYPDQITMFWSKQEPFRGIWRRKREHEPDIALHTIPGTHMTSVTNTKHIQVFAERLSRCVHNAQIGK